MHCHSSNLFVSGYELVAGVGVLAASPDAWPRRGDTAEALQATWLPGLSHTLCYWQSQVLSLESMLFFWNPTVSHSDCWKQEACLACTCEATCMQLLLQRMNECT